MTADEIEAAIESLTNKIAKLDKLLAELAAEQQQSTQQQQRQAESGWV